MARCAAESLTLILSASRALRPRWPTLIVARAERNGSRLPLPSASSPSAHNALGSGRFRHPYSRTYCSVARAESVATRPPIAFWSRCMLRPPAPVYRQRRGSPSFAMMGRRDIHIAAESQVIPRSIVAPHPCGAGSVSAPNIERISRRGRDGLSGPLVVESGPPSLRMKVIPASF